MRGENDSTPREEETTIGLEGRIVESRNADDRFYLLVFENDSSTMVALPRTGELVLGRGEDVGVRLRDSSVSRRHARIMMADGDATITDLDSQNGTRVNGETITGIRALASGDSIQICGITMTFQSSGRPHHNRGIVELPALRQRAEEEIDRALRFQRPLTMMTIVLGMGVADRPRVAQALTNRLRLIDIVGWGGIDQLHVVAPETDPATAPIAARRLLGMLGNIAPAAKVGFSCCPVDGCDVDTLVTSARAAALAGVPVSVNAAGRTYSTRRIGDREIVVTDPAMIRLYDLIERLAASDLPVLVSGETGTGKELAASALHYWSKRGSGSLMALNCAALQETLVESELFGHEKGAFSGAVATKPGLFENATGGTVFLDEIGELSATAQAKLLRVIETKRVTRLGGVKEREIDIRIVAATNRVLEHEVKKGRFREDLFFRLSGAVLWIPPLRDRKRELPIMAQRFLEEACTRLNRSPMHVSADAMHTLATHRWPGNIRELKNVMDYAAAAVQEDVLRTVHVADRLQRQVEPSPQSDADDGLPPRLDPVPADPRRTRATTRALGVPTVGVANPDAESPAPQRQFRPLDDEVRELEQARIAEALEATGGNQTKAAELIGVPLRTFVTKMKQYQIGTQRQTRP